MVSVAVVKKSLTTAVPSVIQPGFTAVFLGATSGIGLSTLRQLAVATQGKSPHIYIVGRSAGAAAGLLAELRQSNPSATFRFIEQDVSLVKGVDAAVQEVKRHETKVDLLFLTVGFISFQGRRETVEGLEPSLTTRYYSRIRATELLLPELQRSHHPHVVNILAGGMEGALIEDDLELAKPGNYTILTGSTHAATMLTLTLERLARDNPQVSFVHAYPGLTATPLLARGSSGLSSFFMRWLVSPVLNLFAASVEDVGARGVFYSTNARYSVQETADLAAPIPDGLPRAKQTASGLFLVGANGETVDNERTLVGLRDKSAQRVWEHTHEIFSRVTQ